VEAYDQFAAIGQQNRLGGMINIAVVKQIGPVLAAVMIAGRVGGAISAQMGTMRVTEQLDAMRVMGVDPIRYLVAPRVLACLLMTPLLTVFSDLLGVFGGYLVGVRMLGIPGPAYWGFSERFIASWDVMTGVVKSVVFGLMIGLVSCHRGYMCAGGAAGVGRAATEAFVASFVAILMLNLLLAKFLNDLYDVLYQGGAASAFTT
jgi:phospholipid/cholesterol/gamma-HCH transport system permease protein